MRDDRLVSILTLSYNKGPYLAECLESVLAQEYQNWEVILVDDGSEDATWDIAQHYASRDARIRPFRKRHGGIGGLAKTHNVALGQARGDLIAILDADDRWPSDKLTLQVPLHEPDVLMSYGAFVLVTTEGERMGPQPPFAGAIDSRRFLRHLLLHQSYMINVTLMLSRDALEKVGGFRQDGSRGADMPTGLRLSQLPGRVVYLPRVLGFWRQHPVQHTRTHGMFIAEYNLMLALKTLLELPESDREAMDVGVPDVITARRPMIADSYFAALRVALAGGHEASVRALARSLWFYGGPKRKAQALYARMALPIGLDFEPILRMAERFTRA